MSIADLNETRVQNEILSTPQFADDSNSLPREALPQRSHSAGRRDGGPQFLGSSWFTNEGPAAS